MTNGDFASLDEIRDIESHNVYKMAKSLHIPKRMRWKMIKRTSRDNARTPMQWTDGENAGFTEGTPWLKINGNHTEVNVRSECERENGVLSFWRKMIGMRKNDDVLALGEFSHLYSSKRVYAFERSYEGITYVSICNMSKDIIKLPRSLRSLGSVITSSYDSFDGEFLAPFEFRLVKRG